MMKLLLWVLLFLGAVPVSAQDSDREKFAEVDAILKELGRITGLNPKRPVDCLQIDREGLRTYLERQIKEALKPEELRVEELVLKKFGLVPADFDLGRTTVDLLTEQAAALYDYRKKKLYILEGNSSSLDQVALVHEAAHALADQHFNLEKYIVKGTKSDDGSTARAAVMEGQATWLMSEYMTAKVGMSLLKSPAIIDMLARHSEPSRGTYPVLDNSPLYMRESLLFPYSRGMAFQHRVVEKLGTAGFAEVFRRPPVSSQQILHPEKYLQGVIPTTPVVPKFPGERDYKAIAEGSVGELDHSILLRQYASEEDSDKLAPRWRGGTYRIVEHKRNKQRHILQYAVEWDAPEAAAEYFRLYKKVLAGKWKKMEVTSEGEARLTGRGDDGFFVVQVAGAITSVIEGLESPFEGPDARAAIK